LAEVKAAIIAAGGLSWQSFVFNATNQGPLLHHGNCAAVLRAQCAPHAPAHDGALFLGFPAAHHSTFTNTSLPGYREDLAVFLLVRGDFAWLGYPWVGVNQPYYRPPELDADFGLPRGLCAETGANSSVFSREYSGARVEMDCTRFLANITMLEDAQQPPLPPPVPAALPTLA
jgi:hypothetical protein